MADSLFDRFFAGLRAHVDQMTARVDYFALYPCEVRAQNDDDTVEIKPLGERAVAMLAGLSRIPLRGLPGVRARVKQGARILVGWEAGDPRAPYAALATADSLEKLVIEADVQLQLSAPDIVLAQDAGEARRLACVGSIVQVSGVCGPPGSLLLLQGTITSTLITTASAR